LAFIKFFDENIRERHLTPDTTNPMKNNIAKK
jgi:hypothetical protein